VVLPAIGAEVAGAFASSASVASVLPLFVSLIAPGIGHGIVGHTRRGTFWVLGFVALWVCATVASLFFLGAVVVGAGLSLLLVLACAVDAWRVPRRAVSRDGWVALGAVCFFTFLIAPVGFSLILRMFVVEAFKIPSGGMCPTFEVGDHVYVDKRTYLGAPPARGDIVVHWFDGPSGRAQFVKRVVAVGGDQVSVDAGGRVTVNGKPAPLTDLGKRGCDGQALYDEDLGSVHEVALGSGDFGTPATLTVPVDQLFMLGDNRENSHDSRQQGPLPVSSVTGRPVIVWLRGGAPVWRSVR
jgi:signal peptidase I